MVSCEGKRLPRFDVSYECHVMLKISGGSRTTFSTGPRKLRIRLQSSYAVSSLPTGGVPSHAAHAFVADAFREIQRIRAFNGPEEISFEKRH
jgi:hypothetical protein